MRRISTSLAKSRVSPMDGRRLRPSTNCRIFPNNLTRKLQSPARGDPGRLAPLSPRDRAARRPRPGGFWGVGPGPLQVLGLWGRSKQMGAYTWIETPLCSFQHIRRCFPVATRRILPGFPDSSDLLEVPSALRRGNRRRHTQRGSPHRNGPDRFRLPNHPLAHHQPITRAPSWDRRGYFRRHCALQRIDLRDER